MQDAQMQINEIPFFDNSTNTAGCCPKFNPRDGTVENCILDGKRFVRATTKSAIHLPFDVGRVFTGMQRSIEDAAALLDATV